MKYTQDPKALPLNNVGNPSVTSILTGTATGNDPQGNPLPNARTSPLIEMHTSQISIYNPAETMVGGYSELIRLVADSRKAKPTIAWYDQNYKPISWIVSHYEPQDLLIYPTQSAFPAVGVYDGVRAYLAVDQNNANPLLGYYIWDAGTSAYTPLLNTDFRFYYMARHQHISIETADISGSANYTRMGFPYGCDVSPVYTANAHFCITNGTKNGKDFGAFIITGGKTYSGLALEFYPNAPDVGLETQYRDTVTNNIFTNNTIGFKMNRFLPLAGESLAPTENVMVLDTTASNHIQIPRNLIIGRTNQFGKQGINVLPVFTLDIKSQDQNLTAVGEHIVTRLTRNESSFLFSGYVSNGTALTGWYIRSTASTDLRFGTTALNDAITINGTTGDTLLKSDLTFNNTAKTGLVVNNLTTAQRDAITSPVNGAVIYNTITNKLQIRENGAWQNLQTTLSTTGEQELLLTTSTINALTVANTPIYTVPTGRTLNITKVLLTCTNATGVNTLAPQISIGANASTFDDFMPTQTFTGAVTLNKTYTYNPSIAVTNRYVAGNVINARVSTAGAGNTALQYTIEVFGVIN
jgi:hypothetical protein